MLWWCLPCNNVNQLYVFPQFPSPLTRLQPRKPPTPGLSQSMTEAPCAVQELPLAVCFTQGSVYILSNTSQLITLSFPCCVQESLGGEHLLYLYIDTCVRDRQELTDWLILFVVQKQEDLNLCRNPENQASCISETSFIRDAERSLINSSSGRRVLSATTGLDKRVCGRAGAPGSNWKEGGSLVSEAHRPSVFLVVSIWLCVLFVS